MSPNQDIETKQGKSDSNFGSSVAPNSNIELEIKVEKALEGADNAALAAMTRAIGTVDGILLICTAPDLLVQTAQALRDALMKDSSAVRS